MLNVAATPNLCKLVGSWDLASNLKSDCHSLSSDTNKSSTQVVKILPAQSKTSAKVRRLYSLGPDNNLASIRLAMSLQWRLKHLFLSPHDSAHSCLNLSNKVRLSRSIVINHLKLEFLLFLEEIRDHKGLLKVGVQIVVYPLSLGKLDPTSMFLLVEPADGV